MRRLLLVLVVTALAVAFPAPTAFAQTPGAQDDRVTDQLYVRHDGGTDDAIENCNDDDPANPMVHTCRTTSRSRSSRRRIPTL